MGKVGPILRRAASRVSKSRAEPIKISVVDGLPTLCAKASAGSKGRYIAAPTASNANTVSMMGTPSKRYQALGAKLLCVLRAPNSKNTSPRTKDKWMPRCTSSRTKPKPEA